MPDTSWPAVVPRFEDLVPSHLDLLDDIPRHHADVALSHRIAQDIGLVRLPPFDLATALGRVSLARHQTPFKDQTGRGTCYAFATCAAMEAVYQRVHGVELDLSEQYAFHLNKVCELYPDYVTSTVLHENNSSLWGFQGSSDLVDKLARTAICDEAAAPYLDDTQMNALRVATPASGACDWASTQEELDALELAEGHVPTAARSGARYRIETYAALPPNPTPEQIEAVISDGHECVVDIPGHCFLIVGFDRTARQYLVKNSWGEGDFITYSYDSPVLGGRYITAVTPPDAPAEVGATWLGRWHMDHDGWRGELVIRRTQNFRDEPGRSTKLGNVYRDGLRYDVNGIVHDGGRQLHFFVADTTDRVEPGTWRGQEFRAYLFSWDATRAAGTTEWGGVPYGLSLSRSALPGTRTEGFTPETWVGGWDLNHDGWQGRLVVDAVAPFSARYTKADGTAVPVTGAVDAARPHVLDLAIAFDPAAPQPFRLLGHTWESDICSGTTTWGSATFGVQGQRRTGSVIERFGRAVLEPLERLGHRRPDLGDGARPPSDG